MPISRSSGVDPCRLEGRKEVVGLHAYSFGFIIQLPRKLNDVRYALAGELGCFSQRLRAFGGLGSLICGCSYGVRNSAGRRAMIGDGGVDVAADGLDGQDLLSDALQHADRRST